MAAIRAIAPTDRYLLVVGKDKDQIAISRWRKTSTGGGAGPLFGMQSETPAVLIRWPTVCCCRRCTIRSQRYSEAMACGLPVITTNNRLRRRGVYRSA